MLAQAADFKREMLNQKHALEIEVARAPSPPLRADWQDTPVAQPRPGSPEAAPSAQPVGTSSSRPGDAPGGSAADSEQTMSTLARLADLRDRGAITPEEFERKKAELLARL